MNPWLGFAIPVVIYGGGLWFVTRMMTKRLHKVYHDLFVSEKMRDALMHRLIIRNVYCEICHEPFAHDQMAALRIGPDNEWGVLAHGVCLGPMPNE